jgi:NADH dehydrogenase
MWLVIHLFNLIGFRNRMMVLINWAWDYLLYERAVRYVFPAKMPAGSQYGSCAPWAQTENMPHRKEHEAMAKSP